ncbi:MAG: hypothetical protein PF501_08910 [Salinisphaera sp.]|jgi:uncharacterized protein YxeA|nr:hypothetical protein [Salinisphaera sp.]
MSTIWIVIIVAVVVLIIAVLFFWYQNLRARESFRHIDYSKLKDLDKDGWDDDDR